VIRSPCSRATIGFIIPVGGERKTTQMLHDAGQGLWLDNITRDLLESGKLGRYIDEFSVTGLSFEPTIFSQAIKNGTAYDVAIRQKLTEGKSTEELLLELTVEDLTRAADLFWPIYNKTNGADGWVSLEVSPRLACDSVKTLAAAKDLHARAGRPNLFIKIPGTVEGLPAVEEAIFAGVPVNVTLLFSPEQYFAAADAFLRGIERRIAAGLTPDVGSVTSVSLGRWDAAAVGKVPGTPSNQLGIAIARRTYKVCRTLLGSPRWQRDLDAGARPQRLLWANSGAGDSHASGALSIRTLAAPFTLHAISEGTLRAPADHSETLALLPPDGGDCEEVLAKFAKAGIDIYALAARFQIEGLASLVKSWNELIETIASKRLRLGEGQIGV